jgi:hypothetical protein
MPRRIEIPALVDAVVMGVIAVLDQVIATLRLGTVDVVRRPQLLDAERDLGIEIGVVVLEIAQPDAFQPNHAGWRFLVMKLVPFVRIAGTRIKGVAGLEKEVTELLKALGDKPHAIVGHGWHSARSLGLKPAASAVDILDILYFVESLYLLYYP